MSFLAVVVCCYNRFCKLCHRAKSSNNKLVHSVFSVLSPSCRNYIGYNNKYGFSFVRNYTCSDYAIARSIREIRDNSIYVPGFNCMLYIRSHAARVASSN